METTLPVFLFSLMRHNAKAQIIAVCIIPVDKTDELLFSVHVVEIENWYVSMGEMKKILKQGANGDDAETGLLAGRKPQPSWGCSFGCPW